MSDTSPQSTISPSRPSPGSLIGTGGSYNVSADYWEGQINPKRFRATYPHYTVHSADPLVLEPERGSFIVLTKFGGVIYWNCSSQVIQSMRQEVSDLPGAANINDAVSDSIRVTVGEPEDKVTFGGVALRELTLPKLKVISLALGQSVALERFEIELAAALQRAEPVANALAKRGALILSQKQVLRSVGFAMGVRSAVLANLTLFDAPPEAWESENIAYLDTQLWDHFDLEERLSAINQKVAFLADINETLIDVLNNRKSHRLEWMIILLILFEIVFSLVKEFAG